MIIMKSGTLKLSPLAHILNSKQVKKINKNSSKLLSYTKAIFNFDLSISKIQTIPWRFPKKFLFKRKKKLLQILKKVSLCKETNIYFTLT